MDSARRPPVSIWVAVTLLSITALAAGLRLYQIDRLPPGLSYDEAWNDLQALRVVQGRTHPVYFVDERRDVEEPLHIYLIAGLFALTGPQAIGGRIVSALLGTLTIPLLFLLTREMLRGLHAAAPPHPDLIALLTAFVLATFYWHVHYTRLGMEPPAVPALATLTFWLLWRAFARRPAKSANRSDWLDYGLAGGTLGLSLYTHPSARFLPVVVVGFVAGRWIGARAVVRHEAPRFGLLVACAVVVFAPLGLFFAQNPDLFFYRAGQASVVTFSRGLVPILQNVIRVIGGLVWYGDTNLRLNLPGRPGLDVIQLLLLVVGIVYSLGRDRRRVLTFPLLWVGILLLPSVFSDAAPHFGRMLGATPALAMLIALGAAQISNIKSQISKRQVQIGFAVAVLALGFSAIKMARDYFVTWARDPGLFTAFDVGLRESAEYLASLPRDEWISFSPVDRDQPIFRFTFRDDVSRLKTFNGRRCAVYPAVPEHALTHVAIVAEESNSLQTLRQIFPSGQIVDIFYDEGQLYAVAFRVQEKTLARVPPEGRAVFRPPKKEIVLVGFDLPSGKSFRAGDTLPITITWESHNPLDVNYTIFVHLAPTLDSPPVAQEDAQPCDNSYPTTWWSPGEIVEENRRIVIPAGTLPGQYVLTTGVYELATGKRLPMFATSEPSGDQFVLGVVNITR